MSVYHHVRKEDLRPGSATVVDPPFESYDVVERQLYDNAIEALHTLEFVADAAREVERILRQSGVNDSRIADLRAALGALSSEDATRPTPDPDLPRFCLACGNREWEQPHVCPPSESFR